MSYLGRVITRALREVDEIPETYLSRFIGWVDDKIHRLVVKSGYYDVRAFLHNLPRFLRQAWRWRSWDYMYTIDAFTENLECVGKSLDSKRRRSCLRAVKQLRLAYEAHVVEDKGYQYWVKQNPFRFVKLPNGMSQLTHDYAKSKEYCDKMREVVVKRVEKAIEQRKTDAWAYLQKHIESYWD